MIYFHPTVRALQAQIDDLKDRLAASEEERRKLQDRLLVKHNTEPLTAVPVPNAKPALQFIAPPGMALPDIQDATRDVWLAEETDYLIGLGFEPERTRARAEASYVEQHG